MHTRALFLTVLALGVMATGLLGGCGATAEGYLYVIGYDCSLTVLDARDPAQVELVQCLDVPGNTLAVSEGFLYVAAAHYL